MPLSSSFCIQVCHQVKYPKERLNRLKTIQIINMAHIAILVPTLMNIGKPKFVGFYLGGADIAARTS